MSYLESEKSNILIREIIISIQAFHQSLIKYVFTLYKNKSKGNPKDILQDCSKYDLGTYAHLQCMVVVISKIAIKVQTKFKITIHSKISFKVETLPELRLR